MHNTALTYLQPSSSPSHQHLLVGTANGSVRRYDTRAARRPVSDWKGIGKVGGISTVENGFHEQYVKSLSFPPVSIIDDAFSEVFVADRGSTLSALDLRNGRTIYTYKGQRAA